MVRSRMQACYIRIMYAGAKEAFNRVIPCGNFGSEGGGMAAYRQPSLVHYRPPITGELMED